MFHFTHKRKGPENTRGSEPKRRHREKDLGCSRPGPRAPASIANVSALLRRDNGSGDDAARPATAREAVHTISVAIELARTATQAPLFVAKKHTRIASEGGGCPSEGCRMRAMRTKAQKHAAGLREGARRGAGTQKRCHGCPRAGDNRDDNEDARDGEASDV